MILNFKQQFKEPILNGTKKHSVRLDPARRWKAGRKIQCSTGARSKHYDCFKETTCISTQRVFMTYAFNDVIEISIDGRELFCFSEREQFAKNDGFATWQEFFDWFYPLIKNNKDECYSGRIIHWTDLRY